MARRFVDHAPDAPTCNERLIGLDLLRLAAIVLVLGVHMEPAPSDWASPLRPAVEWWRGAGGLGVDLFFVLSGFLVSGLLLAEYKQRGEISISRFYVRRAWKIYPSFYMLIAFSLLYHWLAAGERVRPKPFLAEAFFLQSYLQGFWYHTWSLAVEEHFYIMLPLGLAWLARRGRGAADPFKTIPWLVLAAALGFLAIRAVNFAVRDEFRLMKFWFATHLRLDSLLAGVAIAYAYHYHQAWFRRTFRPWRHVLLIAGASVLGGLSLWPGPLTMWYVTTLGFTQFYLGAAGLLVGVLMCEIPRNWLTRGLAALGAYSYSIYLWHMALMRWAVPHLQESLSWQQRTTLYLVGAFVIGIAMAKLVELPTLRLRDRWYPSRTTSEVGAATATTSTTLSPSQAA
jgi:peptidoglycan/LPS O-acetylase OafA/YrhL